jgi:hypothetical protein
MQSTNRFNNQENYILPHFIYAFYTYLRTNSDVSSIQHKLIGFVTEMESVYCAVRTEYFAAVPVIVVCKELNCVGKVEMSYSSFVLSARWRWVVKVTPRPLYPRERTGSSYIGDWLGQRAGLDGCRKSCPTGI